MSYTNFIYDQPTQIVFGPDSVSKLGALLKQQSATRLLLTYGGGSIRHNGLYDQIKAQCNEAGIAVVEHSGCQPNPRNTWIDAGAAKYASEKCNFILAAGGGSVLDASKAIALAITNPAADGIWHYISRKGSITQPGVGLGAILTLSATGSECNSFFVITNEASQEKMALGHPSVRPRFSICDPQLTNSVNPWQTACGTADIISHLLEQYLHKEDNIDVSDNMIIGIMKSTIKWGPIALQNSFNYDARANLMWGSTVGLNGILGVGHRTDWTTHQMEHALSAVYDVSHGAGLACLTPYYLNYLASQDSNGRIDRLGVEVFGLDGAKESIKQDTAKAFMNFFGSIGLPTRLPEFSEVSITEDSLPDLARKTVPYGAAGAGGWKPFEYADALQVFQAAFKGM